MIAAFVLSGGGALGDFEVGALKFLYECGIKPDILVGTSVGAINATKLAEGGNAIAELEQVWRGINGNDDVYEDSPGYATLKNANPALARVLGEGLRQYGMGTAIGMLFSAPLEGGLLGFVKGLVTSGVREIDQLMQEKSLHLLNPIRDNIIKPMLDKDKILNSGIRLRLVAVGLESGDLVYISEKGRLTGWGVRIDPDGGEVKRESRKDNVGRFRTMENVSLVDAVLASASIPVIFAPVPIGNEHFVDGGVREVSPTRALFDPEAELDLNTEELEVYIINASLIGIKQWPPDKTFDTEGILFPFGEPSIIVRTLGILVNEVLQSDVELAREKLGSKVKVIDSRHDVHESLTFKPNLIAINLDYGYNRAADILCGKSPLPWFLSLDSSESLVKLDLLFDTLATNDGVSMREIIRHAFEYFRNPAPYRHSPGMPIGPSGASSWRYVLEDEVSWWLRKVEEVARQIFNRKSAGLPSRSQAWEIIKTFDWPYARRDPLEVRLNCCISRTLDFGKVKKGEMRSGRISFFNETSGLIQVSQPSLSGDFNSSNTKISPVSGQQIPLNGYAYLDISFTQTQGPDYSLQSGHITVNTDNAAQPTVTIGLLASTPAPALDFAPPTIEFWDILQNEAVTRRLVVLNLGNEPLTVRSSVIGLNADLFELRGGQSLLLKNQNEMGDVVVGLRPDLIGDFAATLRLETNDPIRPSVEVPIHGRVIVPPPPRIEVVPPELNFGTTQIGKSSPPIDLGVRNTGVGELQVGLGRLTGSGAAFFSVQPTQTGVLRVPPQLPVSPPVKVADVTYQPVATVAGQTHRATLEVTSNDPAQPTVLVGLIGIATASLLTVLPHDIDFGTGGTSQGITAYNFGTVALTISAMKLRSGIAFSLIGVALPQVLAPSMSYSFQVARRGAPPGIYQDTIEIFTDNNLRSPSAVVTLRAEFV